MGAENAMDAQTRELEKDVFEPTAISPWRQTPTAEQIRYATDLCRSELTLPERTIDRLETMSRAEVSRLIASLKATRLARVKRQPRDRRWRLVL